ncbi:MAG: ECF-type sigma factor [Planctomycetota bacterium]|nr:ECF-type sigma factor [Planctomycetota bacterium]
MVESSSEPTDFLLLYQELRGLADYYLKRERHGHTLQPTALVHEAWERLMGSGAEPGKERPFENREHFLATAARVMRRILIDHARARAAAKRGGGAARVQFEIDELAAPLDTDPDVYLVALDAALAKLAEFDAQSAQLVELRFFAGLTMEETAKILGVSPATAYREWAFARTWLHRHIQGGTPS